MTPRLEKITSVCARALNAALYMVAPSVCQVCGRSLNHGERLMCLHCLANLPTTHLHDYDFNEIHRRLGSSIHIEKAAAWMVYNSFSDYANVIRNAKYKDRPRQARLLGEMLAARLSDTDFFNGINAIVPMPMWWWKKIKRSYNQSEEIARGIAAVTSLPVVADALTARRHTSQTHLSRSLRISNASGSIHAANISAVDGLHILLVDDIITTGATISAAIKALNSSHTSGPSAISVASIALTSLQ